MNLKNQPAGDYVIAEFDTQASVPGFAGTIASGSAIVISAWMEKSANFGTMLAKARVRLNGPSGTLLCEATGPEVQKQTSQLTFSCLTASNVTVTSSDRYYVWIGAAVTSGAGNHNTYAKLSIEGTPSGNYDSWVTVPLPTPPAPSISGLNPSSGPEGATVTISGTNFGSTQGASTVTFNGLSAAATSWTASSIDVTVPVGASSGPVVVTVNSRASNGVAFEVTAPNGSPTVVSAANGVGLYGTQATQPFASAPSSGNLMAVFFVSIGGGGCVHGAPTDTGNNTYTQVGWTQSGSWNGSAQISMWYANDITGGANFIVTGHCASGSTPWWSIVALEISGASLSAPTVDDFVADTDSNTTSFGIVTTVRPAVNSLAIAATSTNCAAGSVTNGPGWDSVTNERQPNSQDLYVQHKTVSDAYTANWTSSSSCSHEYLTATFKPAGAPPMIDTLSPASGSHTQTVTISGNSFGATQGASTVTFNGTAASVASWSENTIDAVVPFGATTGPVVVSVGSQGSLGAPFTVTANPYISLVSPSATSPGDPVTLSGANFGASQGSSTVSLSGQTPAITSWSDTQIALVVPTAAASGPVTVTVGGVTSNAPCPSSPWSTVVSGSEPEGSPGGHGQISLPVGISPCETAAIRLTLSGPPSEFNVDLKLRNAANTTLNGSLTQQGCSSAPCVYEFPLHYLPPFRGTRGPEGLLDNGYFQVVYNPTGPVTYSIEITKTPRPGYNIGGTSFGSAWTYAQLPSTVLASLHPNEQGQFFRLTIPGNATLYASGTALGPNLGGANMNFQLYRSDNLTTPVKTLFGVNVAIYGFTNLSDQYTNPDSTPAEYYIKVTGGVIPDLQIGLQTAPEGVPVLSSSHATAPRGTLVTFTLSGVPGGSTISDWEYDADLLGTFGRTTNPSASTWSGVLVDSGVARVTVVSGGATYNLSAGVSVVDRSDMAFDAVPPTQVANGYSPVLTIADPLQPVGELLTLGKSELSQKANFIEDAIDDNGPNHGAKWITSVVNNDGANPPMPTSYNWVIAPDLEDTGSVFYQAQTGTYNAAFDVTPACSAGTYQQQLTSGWIAANTLRVNTVRHESGPIESHYVNYVTSQDAPGNNLGVLAERQIAGPGTSLGIFRSQVAMLLADRMELIAADTKVEPCDPRFDGNCICNGYINPDF